MGRGWHGESPDTKGRGRARRHEPPFHQASTPIATDGNQTLVAPAGRRAQHRGRASSVTRASEYSAMRFATLTRVCARAARPGATLSGCPPGSVPIAVPNGRLRMLFSFMKMPRRWVVLFTPSAIPACQGRTPKFNRTVSDSSARYRLDGSPRLERRCLSSMISDARPPERLRVRGEANRTRHPALVRCAPKSAR